MLTALSRAARAAGERVRPTSHGLLVDQFLPTYDATQYRHAVVDATPAETMRAVRTADLTDTGSGVKALSWLRLVPEQVARLLGREVATPRADVTAADELRETVVELGASDDEYVVGMVGRFWQPVIEFADVAPGGFADFDEPGYAKLAMSFSVRPYGENRTLLTYEARTATTDEEARRQFRRYWTVIAPFAGYLMSRAVARIRADAEASHREPTGVAPTTAAEAIEAGAPAPESP